MLEVYKLTKLSLLGYNIDFVIDVSFSLSIHCYHSVNIMIMVINCPMYCYSILGLLMTSYNNYLVDFRDWRHAVLTDVSGLSLIHI